MGGNGDSVDRCELEERDGGIARGKKGVVVRKGKDLEGEMERGK